MAPATILMVLLLLCLTFLHYSGKKEETFTGTSKIPEIRNPLRKSRQEELKELRNQNPDVCCFLVFDTPNGEESLPVVYTPYDYDAYFRKDLNGEYDRMGTLFVDDSSSPSSRNLIINGHSSKTAEGGLTLLKNYREADYAKKYGRFRVVTEEEEITYDLLTLFEYDYALSEDYPYGFYHGEFESEEEVRNMLEEVKKYSITQSGIEFDESSRYLTLITCNMEKENSRFILIAAERKK